ncbi:MAG: tRNA uridine-5-carboxymethylaminomethyl(34) synthesis GTPase MnmE [Pseudomonadota bacterium]
MATIYALATAPGRSAIAIIRVSGPAALTSLQMLLRDQALLSGPRGVRIIHDMQGHGIDEALVHVFPGPRSYTGEDLVEYHVHGSRAVVDAVLETLARQPGHRLAEAGEFTRRAFEHGRMDLTVAEAVADLIDADTAAQRQQALGQLGGNLSTLYNSWKDRLARILAYLEADLDFSDQDLPEDALLHVRPDLSDVIAAFAAHLDDNHRGERLRDGVHVAILGAPNAGKSSLLNHLAQRDVAIVSPHAGTTRDVLEVHLDIAGFPVILSDTAGLRSAELADDAHGMIEAEGIARAMVRAADATLRVLVFDQHAGPDFDHATRDLIRAQDIVILNKCDDGPAAVTQIDGHAAWPVSARTGAGIPDLLTQLGVVLAQEFAPRDVPSLTRARHRAALIAAREALLRAETAPLPELVAEDIRLCLRHLSHITGQVDVEDVLDIIFRDFCIGK